MSIAPSTALNIFTDLGDHLAAEGKSRRFTWRNMRATVETQLAALKVSKEDRAWLLSHGRTDVQSKHYDRYSYLTEKHQALDRWARFLDGLAASDQSTTDNVVQLRG